MDIKQNAAGQVNYLVDFLQAPRPQRHISKTRYYVRFEEGAYTETKELNTALKAYLRESHRLAALNLPKRVQRELGLA